MKKKKMNSWIQNILLNDKRTPIQQFPLISTEKGVMYIEGYEQKYKFTFKVLEMCWYGFLSKTPTIKTKTHTHKKKKLLGLTFHYKLGTQPTFTERFICILCELGPIYFTLSHQEHSRFCGFCMVSVWNWVKPIFCLKFWYLSNWIQTQSKIQWA